MHVDESFFLDSMHSMPLFLGYHLTLLDLSLVPRVSFAFKQVLEHDPQGPQVLYSQSHLKFKMVVFNFAISNSSFSSSISSAWAVVFNVLIVSSSCVKLLFKFKSVIFKDPMLSAIRFKTSNCSNFSWRHSRICKRQDQAKMITYWIIYMKPHFFELHFQVSQIAQRVRDIWADVFRQH